RIFRNARYRTPISTNLTHRRSHRRILRNAARQAHSEHRALARLAGDSNVAAHHAGQSAADGEAQTSTAEMPGRKRIGLREFSEQLPLLLRRHADASIRDRKLDPFVAGSRCPPKTFSADLRVARR